MDNLRAFWLNSSLIRTIGSVASESVSSFFFGLNWLSSWSVEDRKERRISLPPSNLNISTARINPSLNLFVSSQILSIDLSHPIKSNRLKKNDWNHSSPVSQSWTSPPHFSTAWHAHHSSLQRSDWHAVQSQDEQVDSTRNLKRNNQDAHSSGPLTLPNDSIHPDFSAPTLLFHSQRWVFPPSIPLQILKKSQVIPEMTCIHIALTSFKVSQDQDWSIQRLPSLSSKKNGICLTLFAFWLSYLFFLHLFNLTGLCS